MAGEETAVRTQPGEQDRWHAIVELQHAIAACTDMGELSAVLTERLRPLLPVSGRVSMVFVEPGGEWMRIHRLLPPSDNPTGPLPRVRVEGTPVGQVVCEGVGRVVSDVWTDPNITFGHASHDRIRSTVSVPIRIGGRVVGALNAGSRTPGRCTEAMMHELEVIGSALGPAIYAAESVLGASSRSAEGSRPATDEATDGDVAAGLVGRSVAFRELMAVARRAAESDVDVLVTGETGVGKTALARAIHRWSSRSRGSFVTVHLADLSASIVESELFGHERGAFTGAVAMRVGRFESADGGTVFLDEIGEAVWNIQSKLLRVIQDRCFERVGGSRTIRSDVRIIAATHRNLRESVSLGEFRQDLFYRLNVLPLHVPPLRQRPEDLDPLVERIMDAIRATGGPRRRLSPSAWNRLRAHSWPGNVRELESVLRRAAILEDGPLIELKGFPDHHDGRGGDRESPQWPSLEEHQRRYIRRVLDLCGGVVEGADGAAKVLGIHPSTLRSRMNRLGISPMPMRSKARRHSCDP